VRNLPYYALVALGGVVLPPLGVAFNLIYEGDWYDQPQDVVFNKWIIRTGIFYAVLLVGLIVGCGGWIRDRFTSRQDEAVSPRTTEFPSPESPPAPKRPPAALLGP